MKRRVALLVLCLAVLPAGCGDSGEATAEATPEDVAVVEITSAVVKRDDAGRLITAVRGTATPGATVVIRGRETRANSDGTWAIRTSYTRDLSSISVRAIASGFADGSTTAAQPLRPKLRVSSSTGPTTTADLTVLKGRVAISRGSIRGVRVTVNGAPAIVIGSRWSKTVTVSKGTREFSIRATKPGADGGRLSMSKTRRLSQAEKDARAARRAAARQAREAARQAREAAKQAEEDRAAAEEEGAGYGGCDPNYAGACLEEGADDYDCAGGSGDGPNYVSGPITVVGGDPYDLDRDGDGVACERG